MKTGDKAELSCIVDGLPEPKVLWTVALQDSNPSLGSRNNVNNNSTQVAPIVKKVYISDVAKEHERRYTCLAKNTIIKDGAKTTVIDTATVMLRIQGGL